MVTGLMPNDWKLQILRLTNFKPAQPIRFPYFPHKFVQYACVYVLFESYCLTDSEAAEYGSRTVTALQNIHYRRKPSNKLGTKVTTSTAATMATSPAPLLWRNRASRFTRRREEGEL